MYLLMLFLGLALSVFGVYYSYRAYDPNDYDEGHVSIVGAATSALFAATFIKTILENSFVK